MTTLWGSGHDRRSLTARTGNLAQFGGVRLMTFGDGAERGVRLLEFRTGTGLRFIVTVDRAMDIAEVDHKGRPIGWHSPTGLRHPAYFDYEGEDGLGPMRSFTGFLVTCGLDHMLGGEEVPSDTYNYPRRSIVRHGLHGRISNIPARLSGYGERWEGDRCTLWAEGIVSQAAMFGEVLQLTRRIEADLGGDEIRLADRVVNTGFAVTPHMLLYHVNIGYPVLDAGSRYLAPVRNVLWASHADSYREQGVGYHTMSAPRDGFAEQVWEHDMAADARGGVPVALVNDRIRLGIEVETRKDQLPCAYQWQNLQAGQYVMGIEPSTHHVLGNLAARERGEMIWLAAGEEREYSATFRVIDGADAIAGVESRIRAAAVQPDAEYPEPTNSFPPLVGRTQP